MSAINPFLAVNPTISDTNSSAATRVYLTLKESIMSLNLAPDTTLIRAQLAKEFNVSQAPLREAILRLEKDGLVISYPQSRTAITKINAEKIQEEHFLRSAVECEVTRQAALNPLPELITKAKSFVNMQSAIVNDVQQTELFMQLDEAFHQALFTSAKQSDLYYFVSSHNAHLARLRALDLPRPEKLNAVVDEHTAILQAIESGNAELAVTNMRKHLSGSISRLDEIMTAHPNLFC